MKCRAVAHDRRHGPSRTRDRRAARCAMSIGVPSARSCMSLSRGQGMPQALQRNLHQARSNRGRGWSCRPTDTACRGSARRPRQNPSRACAERRDMPGRKKAATARTAKRSCSRVTASRLPSGGIATGGSLIEGPGNASVRSAVTLCVGAARGGDQRARRQPADIAVVARAGPRPSLPRRTRRP